MTNRNVQFPNRYQLSKVEGTDDIYDLIPAPGTVTDEGTLINKATLLQDATAALYGLGTDAVPDDALSAIYDILSDPLIQEVSYTGTGRYGSSSPSSVTFSFAPDVVIAMGRERDGDYVQRFGCETSDKTNYWMSYTKFLSVNSYEPSYNAFMDGTGPNSSGYTYARLENDGKTLSWYRTDGAYQQLNYSGDVWHFIGIKFPEL